MPHRVLVTSDGRPGGTKVFVDGVPVPGVTGLRYTVQGGGNASELCLTMADASLLLDVLDVGEESRDTVVGIAQDRRRIFDWPEGPVTSGAEHEAHRLMGMLDEHIELDEGWSILDGQQLRDLVKKITRIIAMERFPVVEGADFFPELNRLLTEAAHG